MPARKDSKSEPMNVMKQAKLSFASKRTASAIVTGLKTSKATRKPPTRASSSPGAIVISESSEDEADLPLTKKRRLAVSGEQKPRSSQKVEEESWPPEPEKEHLDSSDKRWRKLYGEARDKMGNIEPVHGKGQTTVHHVLRVFDLSYEYGPCVGMSRLQRWERAEALGLNPPPEVKDILLTKEGSTEEQYSQSVFYGEV